MRKVEIAIVGAGIAGLSCARKLQQAGHEVIIVDKSRGLGGRLATRRLAGTHADHGVCYIKPKGDAFIQLIKELQAHQIIHPWTDGIHRCNQAGHLHPPAQRSTYYVAAQGATTIAKYLAQDIEVIHDQRVTSLTPIENAWQLQSKDATLELTASNVIIAIPAPQAVDLVQYIAGFDAACLNKLKAVEFSASITAIATYPASFQATAQQTPWQGIQYIDHRDLSWIGLDSSKQINPPKPTVIVQSSAKFADRYFEAEDRQSIGQKLLDRAAELAPWIAQPEELQVHRWRYAFATNPFDERFLEAHAHAPLYFCGDWCGGDRVEAAYLSGEALSQSII
ncbi:FAD-dependent oxidoreductase [filamentous cyanobacterium LEGE 11480]|uniref:FAD-dependent oxidoreductase n=1 Tax=Romeriopsis navalis LEGE 11480 TaxID=2777977 RepID=A0A928Z4E1_9CYAN|nr:FAD-dependent oxidoreductase [Romeriopsis navalis]MBE9030932.1 FAD-dependent oxidoreductase [Romeriopsis navalis LEGE 11480]